MKPKGWGCAVSEPAGFFDPIDLFEQEFACLSLVVFQNIIKKRYIGSFDLHLSYLQKKHTILLIIEIQFLQVKSLI